MDGWGRGLNRWVGGWGLGTLQPASTMVLPSCITRRSFRASSTYRERGEGGWVGGWMNE